MNHEEKSLLQLNVKRIRMRLVAGLRTGGFCVSMNCSRTDPTVGMPGGQPAPGPDSMQATARRVGRYAGGC
jgi:hypothetical protein